MARVRFIQAVAGPDFSYSPGEVVDLPGEVASAWADGVRAELVRGEPVETPEAADERQSPPVETVTAPPRTATSRDAGQSDSTGSSAVGKKTTVRRPGNK